MSGYCGYAKSNNAVQAESEGKYPLSKWSKKLVLIEMKKQCLDDDFIKAVKKCTMNFIKEKLLKSYEYHHTSLYYNVTDYYELEFDKYDTADELLNDFNTFKSEQKNQKSQKSQTEKQEQYKCRFLIWSGTRRHPKVTEHEEIGIIHGNWFYSSFGKKSIHANGFKIIEKI